MSLASTRHCGTASLEAGETLYVTKWLVASFFLALAMQMVCATRADRDVVEGSVKLSTDAKDDIVSQPNRTVISAASAGSPQTAGWDAGGDPCRGLYREMPSDDSTSTRQALNAVLGNLNLTLANDQDLLDVDGFSGYNLEYDVAPLLFLLERRLGGGSVEALGAPRRFSSMPLATAIGELMQQAVEPQNALEPAALQDVNSDETKEHSIALSIERVNWLIFFEPNGSWVTYVRPGRSDVFCNLETSSGAQAQESMVLSPKEVLASKCLTVIVPTVKAPGGMIHAPADGRYPSLAGTVRVVGPGVQAYWSTTLVQVLVLGLSSSAVALGLNVFYAQNWKTADIDSDDEHDH